jgi:hypothetical protein
MFTTENNACEIESMNPSLVLTEPGQKIMAENNEMRNLLAHLPRGVT